MLVSVAKQVETEVDKKTGQKRSVVRFLVKCGEGQVKIRIVKFENDEGKDSAYAGRVAVLSAFVGLPVGLFKREGTYLDENNETKRFTNYTLMCGDDPIPVEVVYNGDSEVRDPKYGINRRVLSAFAELLPERQMRVNSSAVVETPTTAEGQAVVQPAEQPAKEQSTVHEPTWGPMGENTPISFE